jgi:hypothetical protein
MLLPYWPEPYLPIYREGRFGNWKCSRTPMLKNVPGYFIPVTEQPPGWMIKKDNTIWMSLTRMEIESQMMHIAAAKGHTVVAGLGMGFFLFNVIRKPEVTKVTLLESDPEVIQLLDRISDWSKWPGYEKIEIVMGDACEFKPFDPVDFMFVDIWARLGADEALPLTQIIQKNVQAASVGFWGQEHDFVDWCRDNDIKTNRISRLAYRAFAKATNLPLIEQDSRVYPRLALLAVTLQCAANDPDIKSKRLLQRIVTMLIIEDDPLTKALQGVR